MSPEEKYPGQISVRGTWFNAYSLFLQSFHQLCCPPASCRAGAFYFFAEETDMRKKTMPKMKKMAMDATP